MVKTKLIKPITKVFGYLFIHQPIKKPGVYKGTPIDLMLDNETESINIEIEVWDFSIDHKIHSNQVSISMTH